MRRGVLFDLDGTLHDRAATIRAYLAGHLRRFGLPEEYAGRFVALDDFGYVHKREVFTQLIGEFSSAPTLPNCWPIFTATPGPSRR